MADEDFDPADINRSPALKQRVEAVREMRRASKKAATKELANVPYLFSERRSQSTPFLCIPSVVSETRKFFTAARLPAETIASNLVFQTPDEDGLQFALISSSMFITWQRTVGGRLESRLRFANTLTWNTFPVPELSEQDQAAIIDGGKAVLEARAKFPNRSLADHYQPLAMDPDLLKAHDKLDRAVDKAFGAPRKLNNEKQRQELLFQNYVKLTQ